MRPGEEPLVGLNVEEQNQIMDVDANRFGFSEPSGDERFGVGGKNRSKGVKDEPGVVGGDLQRLGDCRRVDSLVGGGFQKLLLEGD